MKRSSSKDFSPPKDFDLDDIKEVDGASVEEDENVVHAGKVEAWKRLTLEKAKVRPYITGIVMSLWVIYTLAGFIRWVWSGDTTLLIISPALFIPVREALAYYFKE